MYYVVQYIIKTMKQEKLALHSCNRAFALYLLFNYLSFFLIKVCLLSKILRIFLFGFELFYALLVRRNEIRSKSKKKKDIRKIDIGIT